LKLLKRVWPRRGEGAGKEQEGRRRRRNQAMGSPLCFTTERTDKEERRWVRGEERGERREERGERREERGERRGEERGEKEGKLTISSPRPRKRHCDNRLRDA
jgi:hypothetical protein